MKKIMSLMLGLSLLGGTVAMFAQTDTTKTTKAKKSKKMKKTDSSTTSK